MSEPAPAVPLTVEVVRRAPKALLHDHLDGGLRPQTVLELADDCGYGDLPCDRAPALGAWFQKAADSGSLERYLQTFGHTVAVLQTRAALVRAARECAQDLAADGVVYAEVRFAPELHLAGGLTLEETVRAVLEGLAEGADIAAQDGHRLRVVALVTAMRQAANSREIAELAVRFRDQGVVGFDIAGPEAGNAPARHLDAFEYLQRANARYTIHAGEGFGLPSIWQALAWCGAQRLGHGVRIVDDLEVAGHRYGQDPQADASAEPGDVRLGRLAASVRDRRIPLELCPSSNVQTGAATSIETHPIALLARLRFRVTVNTDNRLMSGTSMSHELQLLVDHLGWGVDDLRRVTLNAVKSAFIPFDERLALIEDVIRPGYDQLSEQISSVRISPVPER